MNEKHKGEIWDLKTRVSSQKFINCDFTKTDFNSSIFDNISFEKCLFDKSILKGSKLFYDSDFYDCVFKNVDLSSSTFGSHKGIYEKCTFYKCNFSGKEFNFTRFVNTIFEDCNLKKINFNASSFNKCIVSCKMEDVSFNGLYDTNESDFQCLEKVDFSKSKFGDFVNFYDCNLKSSIPPIGSSFDEILYQIYTNDSTVLSTGTKDKIRLLRTNV